MASSTVISVITASTPSMEFGVSIAEGVACVVDEDDGRCFWPDFSIFRTTFAMYSLVGFRLTCRKKSIVGLP
jgi:hypothetical protein